MCPRHPVSSMYTGLDIRKFDDALTFKIAMMVVSYMTYMNNSENL